MKHGLKFQKKGKGLKKNKIYKVISDWDELIENAKCKYILGEPIDIEQFKKCMKSAYEYFFIINLPIETVGNEEKRLFDRAEVDLYGLINAYSELPTITENEYSTLV